MNAIAVQRITISRADGGSHPPAQVSAQRWLAAAFVFLCLGMTCGLTGLAISAVAAVIANTGSSVLGTLLIAVSFPLLMLMAHCLDKTDATRKAMRMGTAGALSREKMRIVLRREEL